MVFPHWLRSFGRRCDGGFGQRRSRRARHFESQTQRVRSLRVEALEERTMLSNVTIVTHGFNSNADGWVNAMTNEVIARVAAESAFAVSDVAKYEMTVTGSGATLTQESVESYATAASGETVIRLDWSALAGTLFNQQGGTSTDEVAPIIASSIFGSYSWMVEGALHLIGHSRGASLMTALAVELGESGVWVDQTTFLDPHPRTAAEASDPDYPMDIPESVAFADGYWRQGSGTLNPDGEDVEGAFNIQLNEAHFSGGTVGYGGLFSVDTHADVHLWYHGTTDNIDGFNDSEESVAAADAGYWYLPAAYDSVDGNAASGRNDVGYVFSSVVGNDRPGDGVAQSLGGQGLRNNLNWTAANWPNLLDFTVTTSDLDLNVGEFIPVSYFYQDADSNADVEFSLETDLNPFNGSGTSLGSPTALTAGTTALTSNTGNLPTNGVASGTYYLAARISDGSGRQRWAYSRDAITLTEIIPDFQFDFGTATSPVATGFTQVTKADIYNSGAGYGFSGSDLRDIDRGAASDDEQRDFFYTRSTADFFVDVLNGIYDVTVTMGDSKVLQDNMQLSLEGSVVDVVTTAKNQFHQQTYSVAVIDGQLTLGL
ncbi:MAG: hypothetical protein KDA93_23945, partial [Planctomycetaceae bacterium]|nr:hypothetical protein [Planctomycetaceae bacterium]